MLSTAEVRWFYRGDVPAEVAAWFATSDGFVEQQPPRVDEYLLIPQTDGVNVKFREGRIEIKHRQGQVRNHKFAGDNAGTIEFWRKWSFGLDKKSLNGNLGETTGAWLEVRKDRTVLTYGMEPDGTAVPLHGDASLEQGCSLELTEVDAAGEHWWSLCFEAVGPPETLEQTLAVVAGRVLATTSGRFRLAAEASCGYAAWLQRFV